MRNAKILIIAAPSLLFATAAFAVGSSAPAALSNAGKVGYNGYANQELDTAVDRANAAYAAKDITSIHEHLHQLINCIVGPQGAGYDAGMDNPCQRMGHGALQDVPQGSDETRLLNDALNQATSALSVQDVASAHSTSKKILNELEDAQNALKQ